MEEIDSKNTILAYLDLLGYKEKIRKDYDKNKYKIYESIEKFLEKIGHNLDLKNFEKDNNYTKEILKNLSLDILNDSFIVSLNLDNKIKEKWQKDQINSFFYIISYITRELFLETEMPIRGAIAQGTFYKKKLKNGSDYLFSEAYLKAYSLEQLADMPRIIIDSDIVKFLDIKDNFFYNEYIIKDFCLPHIIQDYDGLYCINNYWWYDYDLNYKNEKNIEDIKDNRKNRLIEFKIIIENKMKEYFIYISDSDKVKKIKIFRKWFYMAKVYNETLNMEIKRNFLDDEFDTLKIETENFRLIPDILFKRGLNQ